MHPLIKALAALTMGAFTIYHMSRKKKSVPQLPVGESLYFLSEKKGATKEGIPVYYFRPPTWAEEDPVFIAFPGYTRNAKGFAKRLESLAVKYNMVIACPEFSTKKYPGACCYQEGNMTDKDDMTGTIQPRKKWNFDTIDRLVEAIRARAHAKGKVLLFGHSAGGQLMHRYSLFSEGATADAILCANAGWFTMPDRHIPFPYGIQNLDSNDRELIRAFSRPVILLMGSLDVSREKPFRDTKEADAQGRTRMERCQNYFHACEAKAKELHAPFCWQIHVVDGAAHEGGKMAEGAMKLFAEDTMDEEIPR